MPTMEFGIDENCKAFAHSVFHRPLELTDAENDALNIVYKALSDLDIESAEIHAERKSSKYLSIVAFEHYDFIRLKIGEKSKWISVFLSPQDRSDLFNDKRFSNFKNKNQIHWKITIQSIEQLEDHKDLIHRAYTSAKWSHEISLSK